MKKPEKLVNIHAHLHANMDVPARVREWERHNCLRCCVLADCRHWQPPHSTYLGNEGVLKWMREYPDLIVGMGNVGGQGLDLARHFANRSRPELPQDARP